MDFYDIHGFVLAAEGSAERVISEEYEYFRTSKEPDKIDVLVRVNECPRELPTKPAGSFKGMYIPFDKDQNTLWYEEGLPLNVLLSYCEGLMWWPDNALLHAGAVAKNNEALVFTGSGNVGKTSVVLKLLMDGYDYLSDDWLVIGKGKAYPLPKLVHVFDYNLENAEIAKSVLGWKRFLYKPYHELMKCGRRHFPHRYGRYAFNVIRPKFCVELEKLNPTAQISSCSSISKVFLLERRNVKDIEVTDNIETNELARRTAYVNLYEWNFFFREYYKYVFLYNIRNTRIENKMDHDFDIMRDTFAKADLYRVILPKKLDLTKIKLNSILNL